jgi:Xaa-Pro aminopeptidase
LTETEQRRAAASSRIPPTEVEALLVSSPASVRYLTGYTGSNGLMLLTPTEQHFFTDPRYGTAARTSITCKVHVVAKGPLIHAAAALIKRKRLRKIGFEPSWMTVGQHEQLVKALPGNVSLTGVSGLVEELRAIKSPEEIALIRRSVDVNSEAYRRTMRRVRAGQTEKQIAAELEYQMRLLGAEKAAFDTIVAAGARSALPHAQPSGYKLQGNELLLIDMGATVDGYDSDMTRVVYLGKPPKKIREMYKAVLEAQLAGIQAVRAGTTAGKVDKAARDVLKSHGLDKVFIHSTGHGLGLEIHETPKVAKQEKTMLKAGMVITVEPGAYVEGFGGVRIEDTVVVTESGCEVLTPTTKEFISLS